MKFYPEDTPSRFEFNKVTGRVAAIAQSQKAKDFATDLMPHSEPEPINRLLIQTSESNMRSISLN